MKFVLEPIPEGLEADFEPLVQYKNETPSEEDLDRIREYVHPPYLCVCVCVCLCSSVLYHDDSY